MPDDRKHILEDKYGVDYKEKLPRMTSRINVYIADSNVITTTESPDYDLVRLVSDLGGQLGLWIGVSVITLVEVLQLCFDVIRVTSWRGFSSLWVNKGRDGVRNRRTGERVGSENGETCMFRFHDDKRTEVQCRTADDDDIKIDNVRTM